MAIAVMAEVPGGTLEQYDKVNEAMGLAGARETPPGMIVHFAGLAGDSLVVIDVWESREAYERHLAKIGEQGRAAVRKVGLPTYTHREFEVHNMVKWSGGRPWSWLTTGDLRIIQISGAQFANAQYFGQRVGNKEVAERLLKHGALTYVLSDPL
jgi:hypothetical protein